MRALLIVVAAVAFPLVTRAAAEELPPVEMAADALDDKIRGGLLGQILGNLNGLPHEMKYIDEPGAVQRYTPALPDGARTDDDTDIEWVYVTEMHRSGQLVLPPRTIAGLWRRHINRGIWCSNAYARQLIELGIEPPLTGRVALNPWAEFNISGSFLSETFAVVSPCMPRTAARLALNYTQVAIDGEPAQSTQFVTAMIATAFAEDDVGRILDAGVAALDPRSELAAVVAQTRRWCAEHPDPADWPKTRLLMKQAWQRHGGKMRDRNGYELNTAATVAAMLYGRGISSRRCGWRSTSAGTPTTTPPPAARCSASCAGGGGWTRRAGSSGTSTATPRATRCRRTRPSRNSATSSSRWLDWRSGRKGGGKSSGRERRCW